MQLEEVVQVLPLTSSLAVGHACIQLRKRVKVSFYEIIILPFKNFISVHLLFSFFFIFFKSNCARTVQYGVGISYIYTRNLRHEGIRYTRCKSSSWPQIGTLFPRNPEHAGIQTNAWSDTARFVDVALQKRYIIPKFFNPSWPSHRLYVRPRYVSVTNQPVWRSGRA